MNVQRIHVTKQPCAKICLERSPVLARKVLSVTQQLVVEHLVNALPRMIVLRRQSVNVDDVETHVKTTFAVKTQFATLLIIRQLVNVPPIHGVILKLSVQKSNVMIKKIAVEAELASTSNVSIHVPCPTFVDKTQNVRLKIMLVSVPARQAQPVILNLVVGQYNTVAVINSVLVVVVVMVAFVQPFAPRAEIVSLISCALKACANRHVRLTLHALNSNIA